jgi:hypothetical protein
VDSTNLALVLSSLGLGGVIGVFAKSFFDKKYHRFAQVFEFKQSRYKALSILMWVAMNPTKYELEQLKRHRPDIQNFKNLDRELEMEYHNAMLFASDQVLSAMRSFIDSKSTRNWSSVAKAMRKDLYG